MRLLLRLFLPRREPEWLPLPYEQAILVPEPPRPDYAQALTPEGRLVAIEPLPRPEPLSREERRQKARSLRKRLKRAGLYADRG